MASNAVKLIVMLVIGLLIGAGAVYIAIGQTSSTSPSPAVSKLYYIGNINDLTGPLSNYGPVFQNAAQLAINQINAQMNASGNHIQFKLVTLDSKGTPEGALAALQNLYQTYKIQVDVGPISSSELAGLLSYANTNHILVIGPTSNANSLSIPNDYLIRPDSIPATYEAQSLVLLAEHDGIKNLVVVWRDDTFGSGFYNATQQYAGNTIKVTGIEYTPGQTDYASTVSAASSAVSSAEPSGKTAVLWIAFTTEAVNMFTHASTDTVLSGVQWFGIDDLYANAVLPPSVSTSVGQALLKTNFTVSSDFIVANPLSQQYFNAYKQAYGSPPPVSYSETFYDGVWIAALDILFSGVYNGTVLLQNAPTVADHFIGVDGQTYLDANGDQSVGYFGFDQVVTNSTGGYNFVNIGSFSSGNGQISLNSTSP
jgi:branched-chain amino acid transport system substrate-binding protein